LLGDKLTVRFVFVQRPDDIIAIRPSVGARLILV
jgi:hypothetical protein